MFEELLAVVRKLRQECPWDRKQTIATTRPLILNEAYELDEALASGNAEHAAEELGDYLFMGIFLADVLAKEKGMQLEEVLRRVIAKLKSRHPHVYGRTKVCGVAQVLQNWERMKRTEAGRKGSGRSLLDGLPRAMPALKHAQLIQERCARVGFDWPGPERVLDKVAEETEEVKQELKRFRPAKPDDRSSGRSRPLRRGREVGKADRLAEELGDLLFVLVNLCRHFGLDAESVLRDANAKFGRRFRILEREFAGMGRRLERCTLEEMDKVWDRIKKLPRRRRARLQGRRPNRR